MTSDFVRDRALCDLINRLFDVQELLADTRERANPEAMGGAIYAAGDVLAAAAITCKSCAKSGSTGRAASSTAAAQFAPASKRYSRRRGPIPPG